MREVFVSEAIGTGLLLLLGVGVAANVSLPGTKGSGGGWLFVTIGWGMAVFAAVYAAWRSGAHLNPAVTLGLLAADRPFATAGDAVVVEGTLAMAWVYVAAQLVGAFGGAVLAFVAYKKHFDEPTDPAVKLGVFATAPQIRSPGWNLTTEAIGTFVLVYVVIELGSTPSGLGPLAVALLIVAIGAGLGGPTAYAINPARDLGPRIAHAVLPIPGKGASDWGYAWVPVTGPIVGGVLAGLLTRTLTPGLG